MSAGRGGTVRRTFTADDVLRLHQSGERVLVVSADDRLTPLARDVARERGIRIVVSESAPPGMAGPASSRRDAPRLGVSGPTALPSWRPGGRGGPRLVHVSDVGRLALDPFPADIGRPEMDVRVRDVVTSRDGLPMAAGVLSLREGSFPWHLDYDEIEYVIEGELHITTADQRVVGRPGDVIAVPTGSDITFGTPSWAKFLYVTYPADWVGSS